MNAVSATWQAMLDSSVLVSTVSKLSMSLRQAFEKRDRRIAGRDEKEVGSRDNVGLTLKPAYL